MHRGPQRPVVLRQLSIGDALGLGPRLEVLRVGDRAAHDADELEADGLELGLAQVGVQRGGDRVCVLLAETHKRVELLPPVRERAATP